MTSKPRRAVKPLISGEPELAESPQLPGGDGVSSSVCGAAPETPALPVTLQQFVDGTFVHEERKIVHYNVLEALGTGIRLRFTDVGRDAAKKHHLSLLKANGESAEDYRWEWVLNHIRARGFHASDGRILTALGSLMRAFWDRETALIIPNTISSYAEDIEYIYIRSFKLYLRVPVSSWDKKREKWVRELFPLKPRNRQRRKEKSDAARIKIEAWIKKKARVVKGQELDRLEFVAYYQLLRDYILNPIDKQVNELNSQSTFDSCFKEGAI